MLLLKAAAFCLPTLAGIRVARQAEQPSPKEQAALDLAEALEQSGPIMLRPVPVGIPPSCRDAGLWTQCAQADETKTVRLIAQALRAELAMMVEDADVDGMAERIFRRMTSHGGH